MTHVKICGITNLEDAKLSVEFGADALGFNFYEESPRYVLPETAKSIVDALPADTLKVGVFVDETLEKIADIATFVGLGAIQLHGEKTVEFTAELKKKTDLEIMKTFRVSEDFSPEDVVEYEVDAILLDAYSANGYGGTGEVVDWEIARQVNQIPRVYLAGGLDDTNVERAISFVAPFAVDACSGIECEEGRKDRTLLRDFIANAKRT
jgi:phosphoribosylanthranilate isomerase